MRARVEGLVAEEAEADPVDSITTGGVGTEVSGIPV